MADQSSFNLSTQSSGPVECLGQTFPSDQARREHYLKILAAKLKDPEFRKVEGFPIATDEAILALSDPPYYTACPNPWVAAAVQHYGKPYDSKKAYHRRPFSADVSEGKNHPIYQTHAYHTKVPHRAIMRYILHYTNPSDIVLDGFSGTGMTGVACQLCADRNEVQQLGYRVDGDEGILNENGEKCSALGARIPLLCDLSPAATFIANNYNTNETSDEFLGRSEGALRQIEKDWSWMYSTLVGGSEREIAAAAAALAKCRSATDCADLLSSDEAIREAIGSHSTRLCVRRVNYTLWSDVYSCPECSMELLFWDVAAEKKDWSVKEEFPCPRCKAKLTKKLLDRKKVTTYDNIRKETVTHSLQRPALIHIADKSYPEGKQPDVFDTALLEVIDRLAPPGIHAPTSELPNGFNTAQPRSSHGFTRVHEFYTTRNGIVLAAFAQRVGVRNAVNITSSGLVLSKLYRFRSQGGSLGAGGGPMNGTLYVPSLVKEIPAIKVLREHVAKTGDFRHLAQSWKNRAIISTGDSSNLALPSSTVDYIFVDPPFGGNINYSELNFIWEAWLQVATNTKREAITNDHQEKDIPEYQALMLACFKEFFRVLKPGRWMTVEFSNTQASIWNIIQATLQEAGFIVGNVAALDKQQGSFKSVTTTTAVKQDLVISAYKPNGGLEERFAKTGNTVAGVWDFVRTHLRNLPVVKPKGGQLEPIAERDPRILYDRMVAFYVGHSTPVPLSSAEFQAELTSNFVERDGMWFLPEQVNEYDKMRAQMESVGQLAIFVEDERSAIDWLRVELKDKPQTYQDLQPGFMQQLNASWKKWEARPELKVLLDQNFLCYDGTGEVPSQIHSYLSTQFKELRNLPKDHAQLRQKAKDRWYVPDPKKNVDVETLRNKRLLEEFWSYLPDGYISAARSPDRNPTLPMPGMAAARPKVPRSKKLKQVRTEAVRVGFKFCYQQKDYPTILAVADMLPESVLNEDEQLQMIYDNAALRAEAAT